MIGTRDGASRHQLVTLPGNPGLLRLLMLLTISLEGARIRVEVHLRVGTQIDCPLQLWLQILDVQSELVLIGSAGCLIQVLMELPHVLLFKGQFLLSLGGIGGGSKQFTSADNLHTHTRCPQECHQCLIHPRCLVPDADGVLIRLQPVHLNDYQAIVFQSLLNFLEVDALHSKQDSRQIHRMLLTVKHNLPVRLPLGLIELIVQSEIEHFVLFRILADHFCDLPQFKTLNDLLISRNFQ